MKKRIVWMLIGLAFWFLITKINATPLTFWEQDTSATIPLLSHPNADAARDSFLAAVPLNFTENFDSITGIPTDGYTTISSATLHFGSITGMISPLTEGSSNLVFRHLSSGQIWGTYPISGNQYLGDNVGFRMILSQQVVGVGLYITDDEVNPLRLDFYRAGALVASATMPLSGPLSDGPVHYFAYLDTANPFDRIDFVGASPNDGYAYDNITLGVIPEPSSWILVALCLVGMRKFKHTF